MLQKAHKAEVKALKADVEAVRAQLEDEKKAREKDRIDREKEVMEVGGQEERLCYAFDGNEIGGRNEEADGGGIVTYSGIVSFGGITALTYCSALLVPLEGDSVLHVLIVVTL